MEGTAYFVALSLCLALTQRLHSFTFREAVFIQKRQMERQKQRPPILHSVKGFIAPPISASPTHTALLNRPVDASPMHWSISIAGLELQFSVDVTYALKQL